MWQAKVCFTPRVCETHGVAVHSIFGTMNSKTSPPDMKLHSVAFAYVGGHPEVADASWKLTGNISARWKGQIVVHPTRTVRRGLCPHALSHL